MRENKTPMKCEFVTLCTAMGEPLLNWKAVPHGIRAMIIRHDDHPLLGAGHDGRTITSRVMSIDFEHKMLRTQNSIYYWE